MKKTKNRSGKLLKKCLEKSDWKLSEEDKVKIDEYKKKAIEYKTIFDNLTGQFERITSRLESEIEIPEDVLALTLEE